MRWAVRPPFGLPTHTAPRAAIQPARGPRDNACVVSGVVLWDFDGTLAWRPGLWGGCVLEVLDEQAPGHTAELEAVRRAMRSGFPWHDHTRAHPELSDPEAWWHAITKLIADAIRDCVEESRVAELAHAVRHRYADGTRGWRVFDDTRAGLAATAAAGWRNVVLSNHIPELDSLVTQLGLAGLIERVFSSARTGYEKPHPEAFRIALRAEGNPRAPLDGRRQSARRRRRSRGPRHTRDTGSHDRPGAAQRRRRGKRGAADNRRVRPQPPPWRGPTPDRGRRTNHQRGASMIQAAIAAVAVVAATTTHHRRGAAVAFVVLIVLLGLGYYAWRQRSLRKRYEEQDRNQRR